MKRNLTLLTALALLGFVSTAAANLVSVSYQNDGDGAIGCVYKPELSYLGYESLLYAEGPQYWTPGHMQGTFTADTTADPYLTLRTLVDNDTTETWTDYHVNVFMDRQFSFVESATYVYSPGGWTWNVTQPTWNGSSWVGSVDYFAGTAVTPNDSLDFKYKIFFEGSTTYQFCQQMSYTVPEPGSLALLGLVGGLLLALRRRS